MGFWSTIRQLWNAPPRHSIKHKVRRYDGAKTGNDTWNAHGTSGNAEIYGSATKLRNRSRDLLRNNDYARGVVREFVKNVVYLGISFQAQTKQIKSPKINDDRINDLIEKTWKQWSKAQYCDVSGHNTLSGLQRLIYRSYLESGEVFIRLVKQSFGDSTIPLALEVIEAEQVADDYNSTYQGRDIIMGVELDRWKRPVAYWLYENHPGDFWFGGTGIGAIGRTTANSRTLRRIPATEIIHFYKRERPGEVRGVPLLYSTINRLRHLGKYEEAELVAARAAANYLAFVTSEYEDFGEPNTDKDGNPIESDKIVAQNLSPGTINHLPNGHNIEFNNPNRPNAAFAEFHRGQLRATAAGTGISYQELSRDTSQSNYSSARLDMISVRDIWKMAQQDFIDSVLNPIYEVWLEQAVLAGVLNFGDYAIRPERYRQVKWQPRGWGWVDPEKEMNGIAMGLAMGVLNWTEVFSERGKDFAEEVKIGMRDRELLKEADINPFLLAQFLFGDGNPQEKAEE